MHRKIRTRFYMLIILQIIKDDLTYNYTILTSSDTESTLPKTEQTEAVAEPPNRLSTFLRNHTERCVKGEVNALQMRSLRARFSIFALANTIFESTR